MDRTIAMLLIGLVLGGGLGFTFAAGSGITLDGHDHANPAHHGTPVSATGTAPTLGIDVRADPHGGWTLRIATTGFRFAPEHAGGPHVPGEGHAHVYVNGVKVARAYGPWLHLNALPAGEVVVEVTLNTNDHHPLSVGDVPLSAAVTVAN